MPGGIIGRHLAEICPRGREEQVGLGVTQQPEWHADDEPVPYAYDVHTFVRQSLAIVKDVDMAERSDIDLEFRPCVKVRALLVSV